MPFSAMVDALFASPMALDALYAKGAIETPVRVIRGQAALESEVPSGGFRLSEGAQATSVVFDVRVSDVAEPGNGDKVTVGGMRWPVRSAALDEMGLVWRLSLGKAEAVA